MDWEVPLALMRIIKDSVGVGDDSIGQEVGDILGALLPGRTILEQAKAQAAGHHLSGNEHQLLHGHPNV